MRKQWKRKKRKRCDMGKFLDRHEIEELKQKYPKGTRVEAVFVSKDPFKIVEGGDRGTVKFVDDAGGIHVNWDKSGSLTLIHGVDSCRLIEEEE